MVMWWERNFLRLEGCLVAALTIGFAAWQLHFSGDRGFLIERNSDNIAILSAMAQGFAGLLGFIIAAITFLFGLVDRPEFKLLRISKFYDHHWGIFKGALCASASSTLASLVSLVTLSRGPLPSLVLIILVGSSGWLIVRMARVVWALVQMINSEIAIGCKMRNDVEREMK